MAVIDDKRGLLVVRIVYDGPAFSGKTSSVRALARAVGRDVTTPFEHDGRTLYFDWVDYVGGLFDGRQIRCQIVSAPGQLELAHRRHALLESADAVVAVLDSRRGEWRFSLDWLRQLMVWSSGRDPQLGVVAQINKRDAPDAVPLGEIRRELGTNPEIPLVQSTATNSDGIREAFVTAVRLALERVRRLDAEGLLLVTPPDVETADELLAWMRQGEEPAASPKPRVETGTTREPGEPTHDPARAWEVDSGKAEPKNPRARLEEPPFAPNPNLPGGRVWPPIEGRALLAEVNALGVNIRRTSRFDWSGSGSGFRFHSTHDALFEDAARAREALLAWARDHAANSAILSSGRAIVLGDAGGGRLRLWQVVRSEATLREHLASLASSGDSAELADGLLLVTQTLLAARERLREATILLPCTLWTIGASDSSVGAFVGLMPRDAPRGEPEPTGPALLERELGSQLRDLRRARVDYQEIRTRVRAVGETGRAEALALAAILPEL
jgi:signal recognition particle receptor subunit beta